MKAGYIENSGPRSGVGRRAGAIAREFEKRLDLSLERWRIEGATGELKHEGHVTERVRSWPGIFGSKSVNWVRLGGKIKFEADVYDLTNQTLSFLATRLKPAVVTVHDLIELIEPQDKAAHFLNRYLYRGIVQAEHIIAVSEYTAKTIRDFYAVPVERVSVIYNGVDESFCPIDNFRKTVACHTLRQKFKLTEDDKIVLYVGSDHPRKNLGGALQSFAHARQDVSNLVFLKVGEAGLPAGRLETLQMIDKLNLKEPVRFIGHLAEGELNDVYNLADVLLLPSRFEGFGLPVLEAMAAGTPVICSNMTSLPEVVGDNGKFGRRAALSRDPDDIDGMAVDIVRVVKDLGLAASLRERGLERVKRFSWKTAAEQVRDVYKKVV